MLKLIIPIIIIVGSNTLYNICTKSTPESINPFASLIITYLIGAVSAAILYFMTAADKNIFTELKKANWTVYALGLAIVGLEAGYIFAYRMGWKISAAQLTASICLTTVLLIVGFAFFHEEITIRQVIGTGICFAGLILISK